MTLWDKVRELLDEMAKLTQIVSQPLDVTGGVTVAEAWAAMQLAAGAESCSIEMKIENKESWKKKAEDDKPQVNWSIWDGAAFHRGATLRAAFESFQLAHRQAQSADETVTADAELKSPQPPF